MVAAAAIAVGGGEGFSSYRASALIYFEAIHLARSDTFFIVERF